jgi:hypothetical protein
VEGGIARLTQVVRALGVHLILSAKGPGGYRRIRDCLSLSTIVWASESSCFRALCALCAFSAYIFLAKYTEIMIFMSEDAIQCS